MVYIYISFPTIPQVDCCLFMYNSCIPIPTYPRTQYNVPAHPRNIVLPAAPRRGWDDGTAEDDAGYSMKNSITPNTPSSKCNNNSNDIRVKQRRISPNILVHHLPAPYNIDNMFVPTQPQLLSIL